MEKFLENPRYRNYDTRPFAEIWFSLPVAARQMLTEEIRARKISSAMYMRWLRAEAVPRQASMVKVRKALKKCFGINTLPYTLFPEKEVRQKLAEKYFSKPGWDGRVKWKTMERELNEDPQEDELKYLTT